VLQAKRWSMLLRAPPPASPGGKNPLQNMRALAIDDLNATLAA
jgi:hypothetical protein